MINKRAGSVAAIFAASALLLGGCAANEGTTEPGTTEEGMAALEGTLVGAGASSKQAAQEAWVAGFQTINTGATVEYDPVGSGGGRDTFIAGGSQFAGSDRAFNDEELAADEFASCVPGTGIIQIPAYISPIAVVFNLEGIDSLNMTPDVIAGIFADQITSWDDPAIAELNEGVELPATAITAVHRSDESGTTENFVDYLAQAAPEVWTYEVSGDWPSELGGEAAAQTAGVFDTVSGGDGTIAYIDASRAQDLGTVAVEVAGEFVPFSPEAAAAIVDASPAAEGRGPGDLTIELDRTPDEASYPIVLVSYLIACNEYADADNIDLIKGYLEYVISDEGQQVAAEAAGSAPISPTLFETASAAIEAIQ